MGKASVPPGCPKGWKWYCGKGGKEILIELTVPWEEECRQAFLRRSDKYQDLLYHCRGKGWRVSLFPVKVSCREFPAQSGACSQPLEQTRKIATHKDGGCAEKKPLAG